MRLLKKLRNSLCSVVVAAMLGSCTNAKNDSDKSFKDTAIMITGTDTSSSTSESFRHSNEILAGHFSRSFRVRDFYIEGNRERGLHEIIREATNSGDSIIISYAGHGALGMVKLLDGRALDAMYFPFDSVTGNIVQREQDVSREGLRSKVRYVNNTMPTRKISAKDNRMLSRRLDYLGLPITRLNMEYVQFYNANDGRLFPQELMLLLSNYHGKVAFITNSCFAGQVNELAERDSNLRVLAIASAPYNEASIIRQSGVFRSRSFFLSNALDTYFTIYYSGNERINLAEIEIDSDKFIRLARRINGSRISAHSQYGLRDQGFNFQRFSRIDEFYF